MSLKEVNSSVVDIPCSGIGGKVRAVGMGSCLARTSGWDLKLMPISRTLFEFLLLGLF